MFVAASAEYPFNRTFSLFASAGYEQISDPSLDDELDGPIGSAGVRLSPGPRSILEVVYNHRFDSDFVTGSASYLIDSNSRIQAGYTERIETSQTTFAEKFLDFSAGTNLEISLIPGRTGYSGSETTISASKIMPSDCAHST